MNPIRNFSSPHPSHPCSWDLPILPGPRLYGRGKGLLGGRSPPSLATEEVGTPARREEFFTKQAENHNLFITASPATQTSLQV